MKKLRLSQWAKQNGYSYQGAYEMYARGQLPNAIKLPSGSIIVQEPSTEVKQEKTVIYCRVSTPKQKNDLESQVERMKSFCTANGFIVDKVYKEVASGLNDNRPKLAEILDDETITRVVVENKDRLTRFGFNYIQAALKKSNCELIVTDRSTEEEADLVQDFVSIVTSMCARVYGAKRGSQKSKKICEIIEKSTEQECDLL